MAAVVCPWYTAVLVHANDKIETNAYRIRAGYKSRKFEMINNHSTIYNLTSEYSTSDGFHGLYFIIGFIQRSQLC